MSVRVSALTKHYGSVTALKECSFRARQGEILGLLGPNGAGKSTLIRLLLGFVKPSSGRATIDRLDCYRQSVQVHQRLAYLPGEPRMFRRQSGRRVLEFFAQLHPASSAAAAHRTAERLDLDLSRQVRHMSTGMRQKLALAITLAADVPLLVLDEPTSNLDPSMRSRVLELLRAVRAAGKTVLFSSHVLSEVEEICDRVIILRQGQIAEIVRMSDLHQQHRIHARLTGPLARPHPQLAQQLQIQQEEHGWITMYAQESLKPVLDWLATQPLAELRIEPVGLRAIYDSHPEESHPIAS